MLVVTAAVDSMQLESEEFDKEFVEALNKASEQNSGIWNLKVYYIKYPKT